MRRYTFSCGTLCMVTGMRSMLASVIRSAYMTVHRHAVIRADSAIAVRP